MNFFYLAALLILVQADRKLPKLSNAHVTILDENKGIVAQQTVDVETGSYWERLEGAFYGFFIGIIIVCVTPCCLAYNEYRHVTRLRVLKAAGKELVEVPDPMFPTQRTYPESSCFSFSKPQSLQDPNQLIHFEGKLQTNAQVLKDDLLPEVTVNNACHLVREIVVYQYVETKDTQTQKHVGGSKTRTTRYHVEKEWVSQLQPDPDNYNRQNSQDLSNHSEAWDALQKHTSAYLQGATYTIPEAHIGKFILPSNLLGLTHGYAPHIPVDVPEISLDGFWKRDSGYSSEQGATKIGDVRITYYTMLLHDTLVSVIADDPRPIFSEKSPLNGGGDKMNVPLMENGDDVEMKNERRLGIHDVYAPDVYSCTKGELPLGTFWAMELGSVSGIKMIAHARSDEMCWNWCLRIAGYCLLFLGFFLIFNPIATLLEIVPFFAAIARGGIFILAGVLACACCGTSVGVAWFAVRPFLTVLLVFGIWGAIYVSSIPDTE